MRRWKSDRSSPLRLLKLDDRRNRGNLNQGNLNPGNLSQVNLPNSERKLSPVDLLGKVRRVLIRASAGSA